MNANLPTAANDTVVTVEVDDRPVAVRVPNMKRPPREHQVRALAMLRASVSRGVLRVMLMMPTGAGKTFFAAMVAAAHLDRIPDGKVLFIVDSISLIDQSLDAFWKEGLMDLGVIQADHPMTDWSRSIIVASVQTLRKRGMPKGVTLAFIDEAHSQDSWLLSIMASEEWSKTLFIGLSATPWSRGLGHHYHALLKPVTIQELIDAGLLSRFRVYAAAHPDLTKVKTVAGDFHEGQLAKAMAEGNLIADIPATYRLRAYGRPAVCFCVDRAHAKKVQQSFLAAGIPAGYIDAHTDRNERRRIREQLDRGEILVVCNVGCLTKGVDWALGCIILARPTKSEMLYVQMVGRGLRVNEGIDDCVILDHADNTVRLGFVTDISHDEMCTAKKGERKEQSRPAAVPKECPSCTYLKPAKVHECPQCGFKPERQSDVSSVDGELVEIKAGKKTYSMAEKQSWYAQLNSIARDRKYNRGWVANTFKKKFGVWPRNVSESLFETPSADVRNFVTYSLIAFAKGKKAA